MSVNYIIKRPLLLHAKPNCSNLKLLVIDFKPMRIVVLVDLERGPVKEFLREEKKGK
jgi:hypothetical protein